MQIDLLVCVRLQEIDLDMLDKVGSAKGVEEMRIQLKQQVSVEWQALLLCRQLHLCFVRSTLVAVTGYRKNRCNWNQEGREVDELVPTCYIICNSDCVLRPTPRSLLPAYLASRSGGKPHAPQ